MEKLTQERIELLSRLYNLSSDDNVIIAEINNRISSLQDQINSTEDSKRNHEQEKARIENDLAIFSEQSKEFINAFGKYTNSTFESLRAIDIDLELGTIVAKVKKSVPEREDYLNNLINNEKTSIMDCNNRLEELNREETRSKEELNNASSLKERLSNLLEDILVNNNISSYTRGFIRRILNEFKAFNEDEINELEFLILFPESGLRVYEDYKSNIGLESNISYEIDNNEEEESNNTPDIEEESKELIVPTIDPEKDGDEEEQIEITSEPVEEEEEETSEEETAEEPKVIVPELPLDNEEDQEETTAESYTLPLVEEEEVEEAKEYVYEEENTEEEISEPVADFPIVEPVPVMEPTPVVEEETSEELFIKELESNGININNLDGVNKYELINILKDKDMTLIKNNYQLLSSIDYPNTFYVSDDMYLIDKELSNKITLLRGKGINDKLINNLLINQELNLSYEDLKSRIDILSSKEEINENNLYLINHNLNNYYSNIELLNNIGIELDTKETRNYMTVLEKCSDLKTLSNVFTDYLLNLSKNNGKYALNILLSNPKELMLGVDDLLEKGLEEQISESPELFDYNIDSLLNRIKYCIDNNIPVYNEEDKTLNSIIIDAREFTKEYPNASINNLITREFANTKLKGYLNNPYANKLIDTLDTYYKNNEYQEIELDNTDNKLFEKLTTYAENELGINIVGKCTSKLKDIYISKNKYERNLSILIQELNKNNEIDETNNRITILVSALYNLREENLEDVVNTTN